ncbi:MAG TPA: head GIN domain-containing protein [Mucilaginibacter sp.]|nr:head GIN domain-containing protein [Mucilaginibacter sp.]
MKKLAFIIVSGALLSFAAANTKAQGHSRQVSGYNAVASAGPFNVHIKIDGNESVRVDADADVINDIETVVEDHTLKIKFKDHEYRHHNIHKADIYVEAKSLNALTNSGSGSMRVDGTASAGDFQAILSGSGNISTSVKSDDLHAVISGSGSIDLKGSAHNASFVISGSGEIGGKGLRTNSVSAVITGSGNIYVYADDRISAHITGSGSVFYSGNASVVDGRYTGSGRVIKGD